MHNKASLNPNRYLLLDLPWKQTLEPWSANGLSPVDPGEPTSVAFVPTCQRGGLR
jgi:hypothetical protein